MDNITINENERCVFKIPMLNSVGSCFILSVIYVASLYVWNAEHNRDHPTTIKKRFFSVFIVMLISPIFVYYFTPETINKHISIWELMGFRLPGFFMAFIIPLLLTAILFLGPIIMQINNDVWKIYIKPIYWLDCMQNILWLRNHIVAPLSEEFTFRACMMPLLLNTFKPITAVLISPLFFGVAHLHHIIERLKTGMEIKTVIIFSTFQFIYTSIFAMYSAYLFAKTGHFIAPFIAHAFCNHMGFPDLQELFNQPESKKRILFSIYVIGLISWIILLPIVTEPKWYLNNMYWQQQQTDKIV